jgi:hypothetical protein
VPQVIDPTLVAVINGRAYGALQTTRRNVGNTGYEWGRPAWVDQSNNFVAGSQTTWNSDVGLARAAAGQLKVTDGGSGLGYVLASQISAPVGTNFYVVCNGPAGNDWLLFGVSGGVSFVHANVNYVNLSGNGIGLTNNVFLNWSSTSNNPGVSQDVGLARAAAGVIGLTNGSSGTGWIQNSAGLARLTADVTNATTALANLSDLTRTLQAGRKYTGRLVLCINGAATADGFKLDLNGGSATMTSVEFGFASALAATVGMRTSTALATAVTLTALGDTNEVWIEIPLTLVVNGAGTLIPRIGKNSNAGGFLLTVRTGSYVWLEDTP